MYKLTWKLYLAAFFSLLHILSCTQSEYYEMERKELASTDRSDSLFFGLYLGMTSTDFYSHCWELNESGLIRQGAANTSVYYEITDFNYPAGMDFYPRFYKDKILEMPVVFSYKAWSPWNKNLHADNLKQEVLELMIRWFGDGFLEIENPKQPGSFAYVKIENNRRVSIYNNDDSKVQVDIVDLRLIKSLSKKHNK